MALKDLFKLAGGKTSESKEAKLYRDLMRHEAKIGGEIFGPIPPGGRREFFCLDENTWIWHEEWLDAKRNRQIRTTRYDVRPNGIVKSQDGKHYQRVSNQEIARLYDAAVLYQKRTSRELYQAVAQ